MPTDESAATTPGSEPQAQQAGRVAGDGPELRAHNSSPAAFTAANEWLCPTCARRNKRCVLWARDDGDYNCVECGGRFHRAIGGFVEVVTGA